MADTFFFHLYIDGTLVSDTGPSTYAYCDAGSVLYRSPGAHGTYEISVTTYTGYKYQYMTGQYKDSSGNWHNFTDTDTYHYSSYGLAGPISVYWTSVPTYTIYVRNNGNGYTSPSGSQEVEQGNSLIINAYGNEGYQFTKWQYTIGSSTTIYESTENPHTITNVQSVQTWIANFDRGTYTVTFDGNGGTPSVASQTGLYGTTITATAERKDRDFLGWYTLAEGGNAVTAIPGRNLTVYAHWSDEVGPLTLKVETSGYGNAFIGSTGVTSKVVSFGSQAYIIARETTDNWAFKGWELNGSIISELNQLLIHNTSPYLRTETYKAVFIRGVRVKVTYDENKCTVKGQGNYAYGESCTITVVPKDGWKFKALYNTGTGYVTNQNPYTYTITDLNQQHNAWSVGLIRTYHLHVTVNDETLGSATGEGWYEEGTTVTVIATAKSGGKFLYFSVNGDVYESENHTYTAYVGTKQINVIAVFQESEYDFEPRESSSGLDKSNIYYRAQNVQEDGVYGYNPYTGENNPLEDACQSTGNCTWYAQGRSAEIAGKDIRDQLPNMHDGGMWFGETDLCPWAREGYVDPSGHDGEDINIALGDIVCFTGLEHGHVEIIEEITDTMVVTSQSSWDDTHQWEYLFALSTNIPGISKSYYSRDEFKINRRAGLSKNLHLQGVIHNPFIGTPGSKKPTEATITVEDTTGGEVYIDGEKGGGTSSVAVGQVITLTAKPKKGYKFVSWSDGIISNPRKYTVTGTITIYPIYEKISDFGTVMFLTPNGDNAMIR